MKTGGLFPAHPFCGTHSGKSVLVALLAVFREIET